MKTKVWTILMTMMATASCKPKPSVVAAKSAEADSGSAQLTNAGDSDALQFYVYPYLFKSTSAPPRTLTSANGEITEISNVSCLYGIKFQPDSNSIREDDQRFRESPAITENAVELVKVDPQWKNWSNYMTSLATNASYIQVTFLYSELAKKQGANQNQKYLKIRQTRSDLDRLIGIYKELDQKTPSGESCPKRHPFADASQK